MAEKELSKKIVNSLIAGKAHVQRHEEEFNSGIPDLSFSLDPIVNGWIELKTIHTWPKKEDSKVRVPHFHDRQKEWMIQRGAAGQNCFFLLEVAENELLLFDHKKIHLINHLTKDEMIKNCLIYIKDSEAIEVKYRNNRTVRFFFRILT